MSTGYLTPLRAQAAGSRATTEAYPNGSGMTASARHSSRRAATRARLTAAELTYAPTGEHVGTEERLRRLGADDPWGLVIIRHLDEDDPADQDILLRSLVFPEAIVASDAMPLTWSGPVSDPLT
jgi:hypothetical protein